MGNRNVASPGIVPGIASGTLAGVELSRKARENRARRAAARQGLQLRRNPRRDARAVDYGSYMITDPATNAMVADFGWDHPALGDHLADVEAWLARPRDLVGGT